MVVIDVMQIVVVVWPCIDWYFMQFVYGCMSRADFVAITFPVVFCVFIEELLKLLLPSGLVRNRNSISSSSCTGTLASQPSLN